MIALAGYHLVDFTRSQRWVAPLTVFAVVLGLVYAMGAGPAPSAFSVTAIVLLPVAAWLGWSVTSSEDPSARHVTVVTAGGRARAHASALLAAVAAALPLVTLAVVVPGVANHPHMRHWQAWVGGAGLHLLYALLGVALGALLAVPFRGRPGSTIVTIGMALLIGVIVPASPLAAVLRALNREDHLRAVVGLAPPLALLGAVTVALALASFTRSD